MRNNYTEYASCGCMVVLIRTPIYCPLFRVFSHHHYPRSEAKIGPLDNANANWGFPPSNKYFPQVFLPRSPHDPRVHDKTSKPEILITLSESVLVGTRILSVVRGYSVLSDTTVANISVHTQVFLDYHYFQYYIRDPIALFLYIIILLLQMKSTSRGIHLLPFVDPLVFTKLCIEGSRLDPSQFQGKSWSQFL
jgi:hypothetical protein